MKNLNKIEYIISLYQKQIYDFYITIEYDYKTKTILSYYLYIFYKINKNQLSNIKNKNIQKLEYYIELNGEYIFYPDVFEVINLKIEQYEKLSSITNFNIVHFILDYKIQNKIRKIKNE